MASTRAGGEGKPYAVDPEQAEAARRAAELAALQAVTEVGLASLDLEPLLEALLQRLVQHERADVGLVYLLEDRELAVRRAVGRAASDLVGRRLPIGEGLAGRVVAEGRPIAVPDAERQPPGHSLGILGREARAVLAVPLRDRGRVAGALELDFAQPRDFASEEVRLLEVVAERAAVAIERARLVEALREEEARLRRGLSIVAHDVRGPVTVLRGYVQLLRRSPNMAPEQRERFLQAIEDASRRLERQTGDLLDAGRIGVGRFPIERQPVDLAKLARRVAGEIQAIAPNHRIEVQAPSELMGNWDGDRLAQALGNLIGNAVKYSPKGTAVHVTVERRDGEAGVAVKDEGIGLTRPELATIFEPFRRGPTDRKSEGMGLGLFIARGIVEAHGGRIWAESPGLDQGSTFHFELPLMGSQGADQATVP